MGTRLHIILIRSVLAIVAVAVSIVLLSAVKTKDAKPCEGLEIQYASGNPTGFVKKQDVLDLVEHELDGPVKGSPLTRFDLSKIESELEKNGWVLNAQLYFDNNQILHVNLQEQHAIARIFDNKNQSYYLSETGDSLPLRASFRIDLPVFTNVPDNFRHSKDPAIINQIIKIGKYVSADSFWQSEIGQIDVGATGKMEMIPVFGKHVVELGFVDDPNETFSKLKTFYRRITEAGLLNTYERINVGFKNQVVAILSKASVDQENKSEAMASYQALVANNKKVVNAGSVISEKGVGKIIESAGPVNDQPKNKSGLDNQKKETEKGKDQKMDVIPDVEKDLDPVKKDKGSETIENRKPKAVMPKKNEN